MSHVAESLQTLAVKTPATYLLWQASELPLLTVIVLTHFSHMACLFNGHLTGDSPMGFSTYLSACCSIQREYLVSGWTQRCAKGTLTALPGTLRVALVKS